MESGIEEVGGVVVDLMQVGHQLQPEGHLVGPVVVAHAGLQADVQVLLVLGVELGPDHLLEAVGLGVDELGVLGDGQVGVPVGRRGVGRIDTLRGGVLKGVRSQFS